ncbi:acyl-CoA dehydrogenase family protein [Saccharomonospora sp. NPDC046836]|uniref:acyl-CoA dehydrogenase family protein n=1 Tax=Saccharomonospora sp. NPDC046836 TaxID=3156921 RepID=UPI0033CC713C
MTWRGPVLDDDQRDVLALLDDLLGGREPLDDRDTETVAGARAELADLGLWTVGVPEALGGGGATLPVHLLVLERLGRIWPALGWASAQAHAAVEVLGTDERFADLVAGVHAGTAAVAVVEFSGDHVDLQVDGSTVTGVIERVDPAGADPVVLVLDEDNMLVLPAGGAVEPVRRTGLGGARTCRMTVDTDRAIRVPGAPHGARARLALGAAATAAGLAGAAADGALTYAGERQQFGGPLTALPTVRAALHEQVRASTAALATVLGADPRDPVQTASSLMGACDTAVVVAGLAVQSHGGYGYLSEYPAERLLRDAVSLRAAVGSTGVARATALALVASG